MRAHIGSIVLAMVVGAGTALGQFCNPHESLIACQSRLQWQKNWADLGQSMREGAAARKKFNQDIDAARARFWATYPNKAGFAPARDTFISLLDTKDKVYLIENLSTLIAQKVAPNPGADPKALAKLYDMIGGDPLDHGIAPSAQPEFDDFVSAVATHIQAHGGLFTAGAVSNSLQALAESEPEHARYIAARDWTEFDAVGRIPVAFQQPREYATMLYTRFGQLPEDGGVAFVTSMVKVFGAEAVDGAAKAVMAAPKERDGTLKESAAVIGYNSQLKAFEAFAAQGDDRRYLLWMLAPNANALPGVTKWDRAAAAYDKFALAFGEAEVLGVAHQVRVAVKQNDPYHAFEDVLTRKDPRGYVRGMIAFSKSVTTKVELDAAYHDFIAGKDEATVLATAARLAAYRPEVPADLPQLTAALNGRLSVDKPAEGPTVDNWQYVAWKGFPAGAKATYVTRPTAAPAHIEDRATFTLEKVDDTQARLALTDIPYDPNFQPTAPHETESVYPSKIGAPRTRGPVTVESGEEMLTIAGRALKTRWQSVTRGTETEKIWISDEIPGGLVRKLTTTVGRSMGGRPAPTRSIEQIVESFQGTRQPGGTDIFAVQSTGSASGATAAPATPSIYAPMSPRASRARGRGAAPAATDTSAASP